MRALVIACALAMAGAAQAAPPLRIAPVLVDLPANKPIGSVRLRNLSAEPVAFEASALAWRQDDGADFLDETTDIVLSPPAFVVPPGAEQIVRIGAATAPGTMEKSYRLKLSQTLLNAPAPGQTAMRYEFSLPVFLAPARDNKKGLAVTQMAESAEGRVLRVVNESNRRLQVTGAALGEMSVSLPRYLLAGASIERLTPRADAAAPLRVSYADASAQIPSERLFRLDAVSGSP